MREIYVVGDVHGNYPKLVKSLSNAGYKTGDDVIFVGDLTDRGNYNGKVANFINRLGNHAHLVQGNHELQHQKMLEYYQTLVSWGQPYIDMAADVFKYYKEDYWWPKTAEECSIWKCSASERGRIINEPATTFESAVKRFVIYTVAWEDVRLWGIVSMLLDTMCGVPYDAERTLYEYLSAGKKTRKALEALWSPHPAGVSIKVKGKPWKEVVITHGNPFGIQYRTTESMVNPGNAKRDVCYVFGHVPVKEITIFRDVSANCQYVNVDLSPKNVGVIKIT